jgi:hypothetical protein
MNDEEIQTAINIKKEPFDEVSPSHNVMPADITIKMEPGFETVEPSVAIVPCSVKRSKSWFKTMKSQVETVVKLEISHASPEEIEHFFSKVRSKVVAKDMKKLKKKVAKTKRFTTRFKNNLIQNEVYANNREIDIKSHEIVNALRGPMSRPSQYVPIKVGSDGNCLPRAISVCLTGSEKYHLELRALMTKAAVDDHEKVKEIIKGKGAAMTGGKSYWDDVLAMATPGEPLSAYGIAAASVAFGVQIHAVYPQVNGVEDKYTTILGGLYCDPRNENPKIEIKLMWTSTCGVSVNGSSSWTPDHFVPLLRANPPEVQRISSTNSSLDFQTIHSPMDVCQVVIDGKSEAEDQEPGTAKGFSIHCALQVPQIVSVLSDQELPMVSKVPNGQFSNMAFIVDYKNNLKNHELGLKQQHFDPNRAYKRPSTNYAYYVLTNGAFQFVTKDSSTGLYCKSGKLLNHQPEKEHIFLLRKVDHLHHSKTYKKRTSYFTEVPESHKFLLGRALVEFIGDAPPTKIHGNSLTNTNPYIRMDPKIIAQAKELCKTKTPSQVYSALSQAEDSSERLRDGKCAQNLKHAVKLVDPSAGVYPSIADEVLGAMNMLGKGFAKHMWVGEGSNVAFICYLDTNLNEMANSCTDLALYPCVCSMDKTYNMSAYFVTPLTYQNRLLIRNGKINLSSYIFLIEFAHSATPR